MNIFVTGASSFIGKNFCKLAIKNGFFVYALSRKKNIFFSKNKNCKMLVGKLTDNWNKELKKTNLLIHFASAGPLTKNKEEIFDVNIFDSLKLFENAINCNCKKWLVISSSSEYGFRNKKFYSFSKNENRLPDNEYGLSKAIFTDLIISLAKKEGCKVRVLRLFPVYGNGENENRLYPSLMNSIKKKIPFFVKNPTEKRDFTSINYAVRRILSACNFNLNKFNFFQVWNVSEQNVKSVKAFVIELWKKNRGSNKIIFNKNTKNFCNHVSKKNSIWSH